MSPRPSLQESTHVMDEGKLVSYETFWRDNQPWLKQCGYTLRKRYQPDWVASWLEPQTNWLHCEDAVIPARPNILDASREDGSLVALKRVNLSWSPTEAEIGKLLSSETFASNPMNHCAPIYDVLQVPGDEDRLILVMPLLYSTEMLPFGTIGEIIDFFRQIFEGLQFMHQNHIAHRDCKYDNIMADIVPLYDSPPHPFYDLKTRDFSRYVKQRSSRTRTPIKYYFVDFGLSRQYNPKEGPHLEAPGWGGDKSVPEFRGSKEPCDPFPVDVYCLGNIIRRYFLEGYDGEPGKKGLKFMASLVADMVKDDPKQRLTMDEVVARFNDITKRLSGWKLRSRVAKKNERRLRGVVHSVVHWTKQVGFIARRVPAIPTRAVLV